MADICVWSGVEFGMYSPGDTTWNDVPGLYIFAVRSSTDPTKWRALYIGQTRSFATRMPGHERWGDAQNLGATHIHACIMRDSARREREEERLIQAFNPPLNQL